MWQFGLHNRCFWLTRSSKIKTIARRDDALPVTRQNARRRQTKRARLFSPRACAEKSLQAPKNAANRAPNCAEIRRKGAFQQAEKQPRMLIFGKPAPKTSTLFKTFSTGGTVAAGLKSLHADLITGGTSENYRHRRGTQENYLKRQIQIPRPLREGRAHQNYRNLQAI